MAKGRPRFTRSGHAYTPKKTRDAETTIQLLAKSQFKFHPLEGPISLSVVFQFRAPKKPKHKTWHVVRPDADNLCKLVCDSLNGICWVDDSQVVDLHIQKKYCLEGTSPKIVLTFEELGGSV